MITRIGLAAFAVAAMTQSTQASSITSDMWVYQLSAGSLQLSGSSIYATTVIPEGAVVPPGCSATPRASGDVELDCNLSGPDANYKYFAGEPYEIDLTETKLGFFLSLDSFDTTVAFNEDDVFCSGIIKCYSSTYEPWYQRNYETGALSYDVSISYGDQWWNVSLDPAGGGFSGYIDFLNPCSDFCTWDYGTGGYWYKKFVFGFSVDVRGSAVLVSVPSVPLPAAVWMLLAAFGLLVGLGKRRDVVLHKSVEGPA